MAFQGVVPSPQNRAWQLVSADCNLIPAMVLSSEFCIPRCTCLYMAKWRTQGTQAQGRNSRISWGRSAECLSSENAGRVKLSDLDCHDSSRLSTGMHARNLNIFPQADLTSNHKHWAPSNRNLFSHSSGGQKSEIKVLAGLGVLQRIQWTICFLPLLSF